MKRTAGPNRTAWQDKPTPDRPIKPVGWRSRAATSNQAKDDDHSIPWSEVRLIAYTRAGGRCEVCGCQLNIANMEGHHRLKRALGPDCPCNTLSLCSTCHHGREVHAGPEDARLNGRIVSTYDERPPAEVPVVVIGMGAVLLTCGGTYV